MYCKQAHGKGKVLQPLGATMTGRHSRPQSQDRAVPLRLIEGGSFVVVPGRIVESGWQLEVDLKPRESGLQSVSVFSCATSGASDGSFMVVSCLLEEGT